MLVMKDRQIDRYEQQESVKKIAKDMPDLKDSKTNRQI